MDTCLALEPSCCSGTGNNVKKIGNYYYDYRKLLGRGAFSQVYLGINGLTKAQVIVKVSKIPTKPELLAMQQQQIEILTQLDSPFTVKCVTVMKSDNNCYVVMEATTRTNLQQHLGKSGRREKALNETKQGIFNISSNYEEIIYGVFEGLKYLASQSIVHRDLKTDNIFLDQSGRGAKIGDYGFAVKSLGEFCDRMFVGTPDYLPPQAIFEQKYGPKTDVWSFGVIVYRMVFGRVPTHECTNPQQLSNKLTQPINLDAEPYKIGSELAQLLQGCLQPNSYLRWNIQKLQNCSYIKSLVNKYCKLPKQCLSFKKIKNIKLSMVNGINQSEQQSPIKKDDLRQSLSSANNNYLKKLQSLSTQDSKEAYPSQQSKNNLNSFDLERSFDSSIINIKLMGQQYPCISKRDSNRSNKHQDLKRKNPQISITNKKTAVMRDNRKPSSKQQSNREILNYNLTNLLPDDPNPNPIRSLNSIEGTDCKLHKKISLREIRRTSTK